MLKQKEQNRMLKFSILFCSFHSNIWNINKQIALNSSSNLVLIVSLSYISNKLQVMEVIRKQLNCPSVTAPITYHLLLCEWCGHDPAVLLLFPVHHSGSCSAFKKRLSFQAEISINSKCSKRSWHTVNGSPPPEPSFRLCFCMCSFP